MDNIKNSNKNIGKYALITGVIFFISVVSAYIFNFVHTPISSDPDKWGVFGDYIGGVVNPLIGLVTIWLLTVSLKQNQDMLEHARSELKLAITELKRNQEIQAATENALQQQISLAQSTRDIDGAISLINYWQEKHHTLVQAEREEIEHAIRLKKPQIEIEKIKESYDTRITRTLDKAGEFDHIIGYEAHRLLKKYPPFNVTLE